MYALSVTAVFLLVVKLSIEAEEVNVTISSGTIVGLSLDTKAGVNYFSFRGIPYAQPPLGELRFQAPKPVQPWTGVFNATQFGNHCFEVQKDSPTENEDCLFVNVHTPQLTCNTTYPVMVFIHGGGFRSGKGNFGPEYFVENDVILVSLNYRLGPFGFLSSQDTIIPGNAGLKDQKLALKWVQENIKNFCGDPSSVTLFGQSAGAASVGYQILSNEGLFRAAILESGSPLSAWAFQRDPKHILNTTLYVISNISNTPLPENDNSEAILKYLQALDSRIIDAASFEVTKQFETTENLQQLQGYFYAPSVEEEHEEAFLTESTFEKFSKGSFVNVPVIIGINSEEYLDKVTREQLEEYINSLSENPEQFVPIGMNYNDRKTAKEIGKKIKEFYNIYINSSTFNEAEEAAGTRFFSDAGFTRSILKQAQLQSNYTNVYFYKFSYHGLLGGGNKTLEGIGKVKHSEELNYLFSCDKNINEYPASDILTHRRLIKLWTNFAHNQIPIVSKEELFQNVTWPKLDPENTSRIFYLDIDENLSLKTNPRGGSFDFWNSLYEKYGNPPYLSY